MQVDDCYQLGYVIKPHGLSGALQILLDVDAPDTYSNLESVFVLKGQQLVPFFIQSMAVRGDKAILTLEEVEDIEAAKLLKGKELYLPLTMLPELVGDEFYYHELAGFSLEDETAAPVGSILAVLEAGAQDLLQVAHPSGKEVLIPLTDALILKVEKDEKKLVMKIPEGLLDVYLNEDP